MKCEQRPFKKNQTRKKTPEIFPTVDIEAFIYNVSQVKTFFDTVALSNINYNININSSTSIHNHTEDLININKIELLAWKRVNPIQRIAFYFYCLTTNPTYSNMFPFTLNLSKEMEESYGNDDLDCEKMAICIRKRLDDEFLKYLHYIPKFSFIIETIPYLHIHGIAEVLPETREELRKAMKIAAFGEDYAKSKIHRRILRIEKGYRKTPDHWFNYITKYESAAESVFITSSFKREIQAEYETLRNKHNAYKKAQKTIQGIIKAVQQEQKLIQKTQELVQKTQKIIQTAEVLIQKLQKTIQPDPTEDIKQTKEQLETKAQDKSQTTDTFTDKPVFFNIYSYILSIQRWYYLIRPPPLVQCIIMLYLIVFILSLWENLYIA